MSNGKSPSRREHASALSVLKKGNFITDGEETAGTAHAMTARIPRKKSVRVPQTPVETALAIYHSQNHDLATVDRGKASAGVDAGANAINKLNAQLDGLKRKKRARQNNRSLTHSPVRDNQHNDDAAAGEEQEIGNTLNQHSASVDELDASLGSKLSREGIRLGLQSSLKLPPIKGRSNYIFSRGGSRAGSPNRKEHLEKLAQPRPDMSFHGQQQKIPLKKEHKIKNERIYLI